MPRRFEILRTITLISINIEVADDIIVVLLRVRGEGRKFVNKVIHEQKHFGQRSGHIKDISVKK
jgi:hypothetical protein